MYLQELVEVAIGLIFVWFVVSLATIQVQELIADLLAKRATDLEQVIGNLLNDPKTVENFYNHPLIKCLSQPLSDKTKGLIKDLQEKSKNSKLNLLEALRLRWARARPSYIPARNFSAAIFEIVANAGTQKSPIHTTMTKLRSTIDGLQDPNNKAAARTMLNEILKLGQLAASTTLGQQLQGDIKEALDKQLALLGDQHKELKDLTEELHGYIQNHRGDLGNLFLSDATLDQLRTGIAMLGANPDLPRALQSLLAGAEDYAANVDTALAVGRKNVEQWFNNTMDRMTGWYKRWALTMAFVIGLALAAAFNVDSINIATKLWQEPQLRQAYSTYIADYISQQAGKDTDKTPQLSSQDLDNIRQDVLKLQLPIGWNENSWKDFTADTPLGVVLKVVLKVVGFLITALATMQGAPFWFDILKKLVNIRAAGINPAEKPSAEATPTAG